MNEIEKRIFDYIVGYKRINDGVAPSFREIGYNCGVSSVSMVRYYLAQLTNLRLIEMIPGKAGGIKVTGGQWVYKGDADGNEKGN